jgi:DNA-binding SARP family transcriptional activator
MDCQPFHIQLLGTFRMDVGTTPVPSLHAPRLQALLAYLLLHRDAPQPRRQIAFCLWPASSEAQALTNLRNLIHQLRHLLPESAGFLEHDGPTLHWNYHLPLDLDVSVFEQALAQADQLARQAQPEPTRAALEAAIAAYGGELLPSCYDEWILPERERLRRAYLGGLERLISLLDDQRDYQAAIPYALRLVQAEPLSEVTYLQLMRLHALAGDRAAALQIYQSCAETLQRELAIEPGPSLRAAYERLLGHARLPPTAGAPAPSLPMVGRQAEWHRLLQIWRAAAAGQPHLLIISGEAGIGKTRLAEEALYWAGQQGYVTARAQCYATEGALAYLPISAWLRAPAIGAALASLEPTWLTEIAHLVPELLQGRPELAAPGSLAEPWQRQRLFAALRRALLAAGQPLMLLIDDLHWCDQASLEVLHALLHDDSSDRLLVLATFRPDELDPAGPAAALVADRLARDRASLIELPLLDAAETRELAAYVLGYAPDHAQDVAIYHASEGNPLFVIETLRADGLLQRAWAVGGPELAQGAPPTPLPARVQAVIDWRLGRLSPLARELAGVAAVIGRDFDLAMVEAVCSEYAQSALLCGLEELLQRRIMRTCPDGSLNFSHACLREALYAQLSPPRRHALHARVAAALEALAGASAARA